MPKRTAVVVDTIPRRNVRGAKRHGHDELQQLCEINTTHFTQEEHEAFYTTTTAHASLHNHDDGGRRRVRPSHAAEKGLLFVDGSKGTSKTVFYTTLLAAIRAREKKALGLWLKAAGSPLFSPAPALCTPCS